MPTYQFAPAGLPPQTDVMRSSAIVTEAYTVIPASVNRDIVTGPLPYWESTRTWIINRPVAGGATTFAQYLVEVAPGGGSDRPEEQPEVESFIFLMNGALTVTIEGTEHQLTPGGFAFLPPGCQYTVRNGGGEPAQFSWLRKRYQWIDGHTPQPVVGNEQDLPAKAMEGTDGKWATTRMLDPDDMTFDMHCNIVTFQPGACIPFLETHVMEHGLYVLEGKGVYNLNNDWVEVEAGDYMSLRAFCPQACYAGGPGPFRYLLYKDVNRQIML
ncbi:(S)-ureidoglycine aminohydrolase [Micrococcales bacterium 31B]|nr:(S)-ureidoglycine aminohydrolase [Micrococcales bacterium 31B]